MGRGRRIRLAFAGGVIAVVAAVHLLWRLDGIRRIRRAGPRLLLATRHRIWREPTLADPADLRFGPGGAQGVPLPPFQFRRASTSPVRSRASRCATRAAGCGG